MAILTLQPDAAAGIDTRIFSPAPTANYGIGTSMSAGDNGSGGISRGLIKFDLSALPVGAVVSSAILTLYCSSQTSATDYNVAVHRSLVMWYEGVQNGATPSAGQDGSTWNLRNANGSVAWAGGAGGASGSDWFATATDTTLITESSAFFDWDVTADVQDFVDGTFTNNGWWLIGAVTSGSLKTFEPSDHPTASERPELTITYLVPATDMEGSSAGVATVTATIHADGTLVGTSSGVAEVTGTLRTNQIAGSIAGTSTVVGDLSATLSLIGLIAGTSTATARLTGDAELVGSASGIATVTARGGFEGQLRGTSSGVSSAVALGLALARNVVAARGCYGEALLYITDGTTKGSGQLNLLNFIDPKIGYILSQYRPGIAQYKEGGTWSDSPHGTGRSLVKRVFGNVIDIFELKARSYNQDTLIEFIKELLGWQEAAADYETSDWASLPVYLVSKAKYESNPRYAHIRMMSIPELDNPYAQPFFGVKMAAIEQLTLRMERGIWLDNPPGQYTCVAISSVRSWTVAGWDTGS